MNDQVSAQVKEVLDRARRIETRLTKFLEQGGFDTGVRRPMWDNDGVVHVPNLACGISDIMSVIPTSWDADEEVIVMFQRKAICSVMKTQP